LLPPRGGEGPFLPPVGQGHTGGGSPAGTGTLSLALTFDWPVPPGQQAADATPNPEMKNGLQLVPPEGPK
jgi:hypothetical protein